MSTFGRKKSFHVRVGGINIFASGKKVSPGKLGTKNYGSVKLEGMWSCYRNWGRGDK